MNSTSNSTNNQEKSFLDVPVSLFPDSWNTTPIGIHSMRDLLQDIKGGKYKGQIQRLRKLIADGKEDEYQEKKEALPGFTMSAHLSTRAAEDKVPLSEKLIAHSNLLQVDLDDIQNLEEFRARIDADKYTAFSFLSPGGDLKVGIRIDGSRHEASFTSIQRYYLERYEKENDPKVKEITRLCYVSYDPDVFINEQAEIFPVDPASERVAERKESHFESFDYTDRSEREKRYGEQALSTARMMIERSIDGQKLNELLKAAELLGGYVQGGMLTLSAARDTLRSAIGAKKNVKDPQKADRAIEDGLRHGRTSAIEFEELERRRLQYLDENGFSVSGHTTGNKDYYSDHNENKPEVSLFWIDKKDGRKHLFKHKKAAAILGPLIKDMLYDGITKRWMRYQCNFWQAVTDLEAAQTIDRLITTIEPDADYNVAYLNGVMGQLSLYLCWDDHQSPANTIPFRNGVLFLDDMSFKPNVKEHFFTWQLPFDYSSMATCEPVKKWLRETVKDSAQVELLRAYLNAILAARADLHRYLELIGPGGSGKGTFIRLAEAITGTSNVHVTELKHLENNRFETAKLYGKRLCTITDAEKYSGDVSTLKAITGGDSIRFEEKNKQNGQPFRFQGMVLIAANQDICSSDYTSGLQRRRITARFENVVPTDKRRNLDCEFQPFLSGVIVWVLNLSQSRVTELLRDTEKHVKTLAGTSMQTLLNVNPIAAWAHENLIYSPDSRTNVGRLELDSRNKKIINADEKLYPNYCKWATETNRKQPAMNSFVGSLKDLLCYQLKLSGAQHKRDKTGGHFTCIGIRKSGTDKGLSPLEAHFGKGVDEGEVTPGDTEVTQQMTDQTRMVTKVTHFIEKKYIQNSGALEMDGKYMEINVNPQKAVTSIIEPKSPSPAVSPGVTGVTETSDKNPGGNIVTRII